MLARLNVHGAELPALNGVVHAFDKAQFLFFVVDRKPVLDQIDARTHQHLLEKRACAQKLAIFSLCTEAHHTFDPRTVVPAAIEQHDLPGGREVLNVPLEIPLSAFALSWGAKRDDAADPRVQRLGNALNGPAFAGGVAALEEHAHLEFL